MFDEETERLAAEVGLEIIHPPAALRKRLDSKIVTTQIGNDAGVPSVPNVLGRAGSYEQLLALAAAHGIGDDLVVQTPYGDSGRTTFFIRTADDFAKDARRPGVAGAEGDAAHPPVRGVRRGRHHAARHHRRAVRGLDRRPPRADAVQGRLVRQRPLPRRARRAAARRCERHGAAARRPAREGGVPRLLRGRLPRRSRHRRHLPRRAQPARVGTVADHPRDARGIRRRAAVPLPPARVPRRRLRDRRGRDQRALGAARCRRRLVAADRQGDRRPASSC